MRKRPMFWISSALIVLVVVVALFPGLFTQVPPNNDCQLSNSNGGPTDGHPLGFTKQGCDIYSRIIHGTSTSLSVGIIVTVLVFVLGIVFGAFAGFYGGWIDSVLSRIGDIFFSIPYILAAVVIMSVFSQYANVWVISLAIGIFAWPATARVLRAEILRVKNADFVMASTALGVPRFRILRAPRAAELDRAGHRHHDDLARVGDRRRGDPVVPRRRPARRAPCRGAMTSAPRRPTCARHRRC